MPDSNSASVEEVPAAIFLDVPNIYDYGNIAGYAPDWRALIDHIDAHALPGAYLTHIGAYTQQRTNDQDLAALLTKLQRELYRQGFETYNRHGQDIDSLIINDIWMSVVKAYEKAQLEFELVPSPFVIRHVLVSGDGGYLRAYRSIKAAYGEYVEIDLVVYGWREHTHQDLVKEAALTIFLDDVTGFSRNVLARQDKYR